MTDTSLSEAFNDNYAGKKFNDNILQVTSGSINYFYDFAARMMIMRGDWGSDYNLATTPFSQLDRDVLIAARDKLVALGGKPPALPAEAPQLPQAQRKFAP
ncbi:MAG TPA: hypothetical protein VEF76_08430 [Patescibacteria group bacterium]|nr:hypothetical protein [Patescibacteria group bacterium]